jgi:predicted transposase/invertase (TIGR01784 family)
MKKKLLSPMNNYVFKKLLSENDDILSDFLCSMLDYDIKDIQSIEISDLHLKSNDPDIIRSVLDLKIVTKTDVVINIEIQIK